MSKNIGKHRFPINSDTADSGSGEQSHPLIPRSLEVNDSSSDSDFLTIVTESNSSESSDVQQETARSQEPLINHSLLTDLASPTSKYVTNFQENKKELAQSLYEFYNNTVFENKLPASMDISWNKRLKTSCGRTAHQINNGDRISRIELSDKVCDSAERLRDTMIHELCHAACWLLDGNIKAGHGVLWIYYCMEAERIHPDLPMITECHVYEIHYPVYYECSGCQRRIGRWKASLDTNRYMCRHCHHKMVLLQNP